MKLNYTPSYLCKMKQDKPIFIKSISEQHTFMSLPKPLHPLVSISNFVDMRLNNHIPNQKYILGFYCIMLKKDFNGKMHYGQNYYDFDNGLMSFIAPNQVIATSDDIPPSGMCLLFHPDFIRSYPLGKKIKEYGYFSYAVNEALHLSEKEEKMIERIMSDIRDEYETSIDNFSQEVMVSHLDLLLNYCNRFYNRQFITRKNVKNNLLSRFEDSLDEYFQKAKAKSSELPTVQHFADQLFVSPHYLNDMLKSLTGQSTQQHIHGKLIERAKELLSTTSLSVSEIAFQLGFEFPQSFNKLFKNKTKLTPLQFRNSFN